MTIGASSRGEGSFSRRNLLAGVVLGAGSLALGSSAVLSASAAAPTPKLPGEYYRKQAEVTPTGTVFDNICVKIAGDPARMYIPHGVTPGSGVPVPVVWYFHGSGSDHNALEGGYRTPALATVDRGAIAICQKAGGTLYSNPTAVALQQAGWDYMSGLFAISSNTLRSTSGGGVLAAEVYGSRLLPNIAGMYAVNSAYDVRAMYDAGGRSQGSVILAYGDDLAAIEARNPARFPAATWTGTTMRIIVSTPSSSDSIVPPDQHGLALRDIALPVATEASLRTHTTGHSTPGFASSDFVASMERWGVFLPPTTPTPTPTASPTPTGSPTPTASPTASTSPSPDPTPTPDTTAPVVSIIAPSDGATISGVVTLRVSATDDVGVTGVSVWVGTNRIAVASPFGATEWRASYDTRNIRNSTYPITARAVDAAGNTTTSSAVRLTISN